jgi:hypothetical protein
MKSLTQQRSEWVLLYLLNRHPLGISETMRMPYDANDLGVHMGTIRGLEKRGLVEEPCSGLWFLTPLGLEQAKFLNDNWSKVYPVG